MQAMPDVQEELNGTYDFVHVFAIRRDDLVREAPKWRAALAPSGLLWVSYPKGKSMDTDLNRDVVRVALQEARLETVSQVSIDDTWSALRAKAV